MAKAANSSNSNGKKNNNGILKLKERLQKGLFLAKKRSSSATDSYSSSSSNDQEMVPKDVKEGHFAVIASDDYVERRFVVPITYLRHPSFLRLLEKAAEEYGFDHEGALMIPCRPSELQWLLEEQIGSTSSQDGQNWASYKSMVEIC